MRLHFSLVELTVLVLVGRVEMACKPRHRVRFLARDDTVVVRVDALTARLGGGVVVASVGNGSDEQGGEWQGPTHGCVPRCRDREQRLGLPFR